MVNQEFGYIGYFDRESCDLDEFKVLTSQNLDPAAVPLAAAVEKNVPIYDMSVRAADLADPARRRALLAEWNTVLGQTAGVLVLKGAYSDTSVIDRATRIFEDIIAKGRGGNDGKGDHFAASGANDRVWNALQKQCLADPEGFVLYFGNPAIAAASEAWLGPNYQMTAQVNLVRPGGKAQTAHRDYHLGFQDAATSATYPVNAHMVTASLTLQGAVAHCDMPVESGPTKLLPFSQAYGPGYIGFHDPAHRDWFEEAHVQLPLEKGDALFFNPALFHGAGDNVTQDIDRMANLLQVSSAFGRAMEAVDRKAMTRAAYPAMLALKQGGRVDALGLKAAIASTAEGYSFPTNLDSDPPVGGNAPKTQAQILAEALEDGWTEAKLAETLDALQTRQAA